MSTSKTFIKRDFNKLFKNDVKQLREVKPLGKASLQYGQNMKLAKCWSYRPEK